MYMYVSLYYKGRYNAWGLCGPQASVDVNKINLISVNNNHRSFVQPSNTQSDGRTKPGQDIYEMESVSLG